MRCAPVAVQVSEGTIRVLLADDDEVFLASLSELIDHQPELAVAGTATDGLAAIELVDELAPDAAVLDLHMPLLDGVSTVARLRRDYPHLVFQGNVDEAVLRTGTPAQVAEATRRCVVAGGGQRHIVNLNHGVDRTTPVANFEAYVEAVKARAPQ